MEPKMWVCRAGKNSCYIDRIISESKVFLPWDGYEVDLNLFLDREQFKALVKQERNVSNPTSISNWAGMLYSFVKEIELNDYVLIPEYKSHFYILGYVVGDYEYDEANTALHHSRDIKILDTHIPRDIFSQQIVYSLGAYRTVFKVKQPDEILRTISNWKAQEEVN